VHDETRVRDRDTRRKRVIGYQVKGPLLATRASVDGILIDRFLRKRDEAEEGKGGEES
jgi:hypothetical protein